MEGMKTMKYPTLLNTAMTVTSKSPIIKVIEDIKKRLLEDSPKERVSKKKVHAKKGASKMMKEKDDQSSTKPKSAFNKFKESCFGKLF